MTCGGGFKDRCRSVTSNVFDSKKLLLLCKPSIKLSIRLFSTLYLGLESGGIFHAGAEG